MQKEILRFIYSFTDQGRRTQVIDTFTCGRCYWFAHILQDRFWFYDVEIMYDQVINHFGCRIGDRVYDITGDVTEKYNWERWSIILKTDKLLAERIIRDCVDF